MTKRIALSVIFGLLAASAVHAQGTVRIGVLNDMSGVYADDQGPGSLLAAQMAAEYFGGRVAGRRTSAAAFSLLRASQIFAFIERKTFGAK